MVQLGEFLAQSADHRPDGEPLHQRGLARSGLSAQQHPAAAAEHAFDTLRSGGEPAEGPGSRRTEGGRLGRGAGFQAEVRRVECPATASLTGGLPQTEDPDPTVVDTDGRGVRALEAAVMHRVGRHVDRLRRQVEKVLRDRLPESGVAKESGCGDGLDPRVSVDARPVVGHHDAHEEVLVEEGRAGHAAHGEAAAGTVTGTWWSSART